jgi:hypothetical protein
MKLRLPLLAMACALWLGASPASSEVVRFRYTPKDANGNMALIPGPNGAAGERSAWVGGAREPFPRLPAPTHIVTFRHPNTNQNVQVPMTFPQGTPRILTLSDRIQYNWSGYQIQARFLADGSVETMYNSGAFRPIQFQ